MTRKLLPKSHHSRRGWLALMFIGLISSHANAGSVSGEIVEAATGKPLPARLYIQSAGGEWFFAESAAPTGSTVRYAKTNWVNPRAVEVHTTLSAHPFRVELPPGRYTITAERGKEYRPLVRTIEVGSESARVTLPLERWVNMAKRDWFSGDGHLHRTIEELSNVILAEDLNVTLPQTHWVTKAFQPPTAGDKNTERNVTPKLIRADGTHVIWPLNTEYEIFEVDGKFHNLGAVFIVNHREPFTFGAPPMRAVAEAAHRQGALLDMDKCNWDWSLMLPPVMNIDLYELANNHLWRTDFGFTNFNVPAPAFMNLPDAGRSGGERDWIDYTFRTYYALLNCGFRLRPTAGTASGVHPVPAGFGRVYVHCPRGFSYDSWMKGLDEGRSFVTTGPMLLAKINGEIAGGTVKRTAARQSHVEITATMLSETPVSALELIVNGEVIPCPMRELGRNSEGACEYRFQGSVRVAGTSWIALRGWENREGNRVRFAHTAPSWFDVPNQPLRPHREEVSWLVERMEQQIKTHTGILPPAAVDEYRQAKLIYEQLLDTAR
jgi:hypothetical protein